jgi:WW domain-containing oxidoreductase
MTSATLGKKTTAEQALRGRDLRGKHAIVTGANSGLGTETARVLALGGANVTLAVRSIEAGEKVAQQLRAALPKDSGTLWVSKLDLADPASIRAFAASYLAAGTPLDLLINNAGIMATPPGVTSLGIEQQMGTNHLGHFLLTTLLMERLGKSAAPRVVTVSSGLHTRGKKQSVLATLEGDPKFANRKYVPFDAYGDSKLANILFTRALAKRLPSNAVAVSLHPGVIPTNLSRSLGFQGVLFRAIGQFFMKTVPQGAATTIYGATAPELEGHSGAYLSDCAVTDSTADGRDEALAEQVWALSTKWVTPAAA